MKVVRFHEYGSPAVLKLEEIPQPNVSAGQILIKVSAAGVNFADSLQRRNLYPIASSLPRIPGFEIAGTVEKLASDITDLKEGDRVVAMVESGGYSEFVCVDRGNAFTIPDGVSFDQAAALPGQALTAYFMFKDAPLNAGETVLVHAAAGGVGSVSAQIAALLGAKTTIGTTSTSAKMNKLSQYGYTHAIKSVDLDWHKQVLDLTAGRGADVILDSIGGTVFDESLKCLAPGGRLVVFGRASGTPTLFDPIRLTMSNQRVMGFSLWKYMTDIKALSEAMDFLFSALVQSQLKVDLDVYPLSRAADVHEMLDSRASTGKLILQP